MTSKKQYSEAALSSAVLGRLSSSFYFQEQVWGRHISGSRKRVDAVIWPKNNTLWAKKDIAFGIEFKKPDSIMSLTDVTGMIRQAYDYLHTDFDGFGKIPILVCPLRLQDRYNGGNHEMSIIRHLLGKFGIGEILVKQYNDEMAIVFQASHCIWSEHYGVSLGKTWLFDFK